MEWRYLAYWKGTFHGKWIEVTGTAGFRRWFVGISDTALRGEEGTMCDHWEEVYFDDTVCTDLDKCFRRNWNDHERHDCGLCRTSIFWYPFLMQTGGSGCALIERSGVATNFRGCFRLQVNMCNSLSIDHDRPFRPCAPRKTQNMCMCLTYWTHFTWKHELHDRLWNRNSRGTWKIGKSVPSTWLDKPWPMHLAVLLVTVMLLSSAEWIEIRGIVAQGQRLVVCGQ